MFCDECGKESPDKAKFCKGCGHRLVPEDTPPSTPMSLGENVTIDPTAAPMGDGENATIEPGATGPAFARGTRLMKRYEIVCELGRGGMGVVYQAIDHARGADVAVKTVPEQLRNEPRAIANLKREVNTALSLSHEYICRIYDFQVCPEAHFITMELIEGQSLDAMLFEQFQAGRHGLPKKWVFQCLNRICTALDYAHKKRIVHRDLKPGNILVSKTGGVKVSDFGLARSIHSSMSKFSREAVSGTLLYMSPEQCLGKATDAASDIYSLGMMTHELLSGQAPFAEAADITYCQLREDIEPIPGQPDHVNAALHAATAKDKAKRPKSAREFLDLLQSAETTPGRASLSRGRSPAGAGPYQPGEVRTFEGIEMLWCPPGTFLMGSPETEAERSPSEDPHKVTLTQGFWLGKYPVTQAEWERVMGSNPSKFKGPRNPVEQVSWDDAQEFCQKMGNGFRSPTEAEWEYACRAGSTTAYCFGDSKSGLGSYAWYDDNSDEKTHAVGEKKPNAWGLCDMHGNVSEWCQDWYGDYPSGSVRDPRGPSTGSYRLLRGGSWYFFGCYCRSAYRNYYTPGNAYYNIGFRVVRTP